MGGSNHFERALTSVAAQEQPAKEETCMQKITPFLWFDGKAEEAANFYASVFKNSRIVSIHRYGEAGPGSKGTVMMATFELEGHEFMALNGGPLFKFTEAISFFVNCETQEEVDELWGKLSAGGEQGRCGWLKDKFGVSWQIVPTALAKMLQDKDPENSQRVMRAMLQMNKIDIKRLREAYDRG
jgi:predicted 3-demethylubiquinone-9 3-methyltransferase (glyoxalase superfamily)